MIGVLICLTVSLTVFALVALANQRWPDRLDRRARHLEGAREEPTESRRSPAPPPPRSGRHPARVSRLHFVTR